MIPILLIFISCLISFGGESVLVSVYPFYDVVKEIGKGRFGVDVLIPPRADYHLYELSAGDVIKLSRARIVFVSGIPLGGWERRVEGFAKGRVISLSKGVRLISYGEKHHEVKNDPHIWLSPKRMIKVAENAFRGFLNADRAGKEVYERNLRSVVSKLKKLDMDYKRSLKRCKHRLLPVVHPALGYLAKDYDLVQIFPMSGDVHGGISPKDLLFFVKELKKRGADFVFTVYGKRSKLADMLRREYGIKVYELNIKIIPEKGSIDYFSIMRKNLNTLREALGCM